MIPSGTYGTENYNHNTHQFLLYIQTCKQQQESVLAMKVPPTRLLQVPFPTENTAQPRQLNQDSHPHGTDRMVTWMSLSDRTRKVRVLALPTIPQHTQMDDLHAPVIIFFLKQLKEEGWER